jgi:Synaptobrevin
LNANRNFEFLQTLETEFINEFSNRQISRAKRLGLQKKFGPNIRSKLHYYNTNQTKLCRDQKIQIMLEKVEKVQTIMDRKIRLLIERQEGQLNDMLEKSSNMKEDASVFKKRAETLNQWSKQQKIVYHCGLGGLVFAFVYLILGLACGFTLQECLS